MNIFGSRFVIIAASVFSISLPVISFVQNAPAAGLNSAPEFETALREAGTMPKLYSLLVSHKDELLLEHYFNGSKPDKPVNIKSASKSVMSALVGIAIKQGHIKGTDQSIADYFGDKLASEADQTKKTITIKNLLTMQAGLASTSSRNYGAWVMSKDWIAYALKQPISSTPGTLMQYSTGNTHMLSAILTQATGMDTLAFARMALAEPLGFHLAAWPRDPQGIYFGGNDMELTARQMLKFGQLYLNKGKMNGKQIIPAEWIAVSLQRHAESTREQDRYYGYGWWIRDMAGIETQYAWGYGGQYIILVPQLELVVVTTSSSTPDSDRRGHRRRVNNLIETYIIKPMAERLNQARVSLN